MRLTDRDVEHPLFWTLRRKAEAAVHSTFDRRFLETMDDREARAVYGAIDALTKAMIISGKRVREEIG